MAVSFLASTLLMGLFLVAVVAFVGYAERRDAERPGSSMRPGAVLSWVRGSTMAWIVGFLVLVVAVGGSTVLFVGGLLPNPSAQVTQTAGLALGGLVALSLLVYFVWGGYSTARARGYPRSGAAAVGIWVFGMLFVTAIVAQLLVA
jgi:hypothetical protein